MSNDAHATSGKSQELLYDPDIPTPSHAERALTLANGPATGTLCTVAREPAGFPYGSFVAFALSGNTPVFLISELAEHTKNMRADPRASLLIVESVDKDALANGRVTLLGSAECLGSAEHHKSILDTYLDVHPNAAYYAGFKDFALWQLRVESIRYIGGFGRMSWVDRQDWDAATTDPLSSCQQDIIDHMNQDHADTMVLYCKAFSRATDTTAAVMTGIDRYGFEMSATTKAGPRPIRIAFPASISTAKDARVALVALAKQARETLAS